MNLNQVHMVYFLGIGGIGMSALARYFHQRGVKVAGYDRTPTALTETLQQEGIDIHFTDEGEALLQQNFDKDHTLVVLTPAVPDDHKELNWFRKQGFELMKRSQVLGLITDAFRTIGVAGTHGKTTTSTLIAHLLTQSHLGCSAFLGGISSNYQTNLLVAKNIKEPSISNMVVEADEFDRSFLTLHPALGIITSTDADHLDIYGEHEALLQSFASYAMQVKNLLIVKHELDLVHVLKENKSIQAKMLTYSLHGPAFAFADNIRISGDQYFFDLHIGERIIDNLYLGIPGLHNVENAVAASVAALDAGLTADELRNGLASFKGVKRRFEYVIQKENRIYIDDYAHHPEELKAILYSVKQMYPGRKLTVVFQPHLFTRTRDFASGFSESLSIADDLILLDIYPARELPIPGVTSEMLLKNITSKEKSLCSKSDLPDLIAKKNPGLLVTVGAGDIDQFVEPLRVLLTSLNTDQS